MGDFHLFDLGLTQSKKAKIMEILSFDNSRPPQRALWDPRSYRMEETNNRALVLLDELMDNPSVNIEAFKRPADICDEEEWFNK
ncbi:MAG: hypothetical protein QF919_12395 [Nitrospinota bacterium]|jgi:hypothetical protein|nr:hypothetical protein [Nitrospinota bacterium]|tara:strand:- start:253 stop:504 length:252 start_codon:yes stop_codon:yes gene_type:complete